MTEHEFIIQSRKLIEQVKNLEFIDFVEKNHIHVINKDVTKVYQEACSAGNVVIVDFLLNTKLPLSMDIDFPYQEGNQFEPAIGNGAIFLAGDNHHADLLEYFIKNEIYYIDFDTRENLEKYMHSVVKIIDQIELKLHLEAKMPTKSNQKLTIKNSHTKI